MRVSILLWSQMRIAAGTARVSLELPAEARLGAALGALYELYPALLPHRESARAAIGVNYARGDETLRDGDEISLVPPVQGG
jgi:molybdopterin converting factor small subunit